MDQTFMGRAFINATAQSVLRLIIGSYFLAVALHLIPGTDLGILLSGVLPSPFDSAIATGMVFTLAFMVMLGRATRLAALLLALMTFYASYLTMLALGVGDELGSFWRDLALIAALLLTYSDDVGGFGWRTAEERAARIGPMRPSPAVNFATLAIHSDPVTQDDPQARLRAIFREPTHPETLGRERRLALSRLSQYRDT